LPCNPPPGVQFAVIYPAPGAIGLPDNIGEVLFAASAPSGLYGYNAHLVDQTGGGLLRVDFADFAGWNGPPPSPSVTPPFANAAYEVSINQGIANGASFPQGHTISVQLVHGQCVPVAYSSFTVQ